MTIAVVRITATFAIPLPDDHPEEVTMEYLESIAGEKLASVSNQFDEYYTEEVELREE